MIADWTVEIGSGSPEIVVPWDGWVDLTRPGWKDLSSAEAARIPEFAEYPELEPLLAIANNPYTLSSKVDVFSVTRQEVDPEIAEAGLLPTAFGLGSYLDLLLRPPAPQHSFGDFEQLARHLTRLLGAVDLPLTCTEVVLRRAHLYDRDTFGLTLYSMGFGPDAGAARATWQRAAVSGVACLHKALGAHAGE